jgi:hypothetical protein
MPQITPNQCLKKAKKKNKKKKKMETKERLFL